MSILVALATLTGSADLVCAEHRNLVQFGGDMPWTKAIKVLARAPRRAA